MRRPGRPVRGMLAAACGVCRHRRAGRFPFPVQDTLAHRSGPATPSLVTAKSAPSSFPLCGKLRTLLGSPFPAEPVSRGTKKGLPPAYPADGPYQRTAEQRGPCEFQGLSHEWHPCGIFGGSLTNGGPTRRAASAAIFYFYFPCRGAPRPLASLISHQISGSGKSGRPMPPPPRSSTQGPACGDTPSAAAHVRHNRQMISGPGGYRPHQPLLSKTAPSAQLWMEKAFFWTVYGPFLSLGNKNFKKPWNFFHPHSV